MNSLIYILTFISILGCGIVAGIFFVFSTFVMRALARLKPAQGIEAMQSINITVLNPWFLSAFIGTAVICFLLAISTYWRWDQPGAVYLLAGCLFYMIGTFLVTVVFNVPMNNALKSVVPASNDASDLWSVYLTKWTFWNHVRTVAAFLGAASLMLTV